MTITCHFIFCIFFVLALSACNSDNEAVSCTDALPAVEQGHEFFGDIAQQLPISNRSNKSIAVSCHNCYSENSTEQTLALIQAAINAGADTIELDVITSNLSQLLIAHEPNVSGGLLADVITDDLLMESTQILFIELKDEVMSKSSARELLKLLKQQKDSTGKYSYLNSTRFSVIRHANGYETLSNVRDVLSEAEFLDIQPFVKLSRIYFPDKSINVEQIHQCGFHMVEFDYRIGSQNINKKNQLAQSVGLGVNIFTLDSKNYKSVITELDQNFDSVTIEPSNKKSQVFEKNSIFEQVKQFIANG